MRRFKTITAALTLTAALAACSSTENEGADPTTGRTELKITAGITTRASNSEWQANDAIGLIMFDAGTTTPSDGKTNYRYTTGGDGSFSADGDANKAYLPSGGGFAELTAYYPQTAAVTTSSLIVPVDVTTQTNPAAIDLMVADKVTGLSATNSSANLTFSHKLSKLILKVNKNADGSADAIDIAGATVVIMGTKATASWNIATATLTQTGAATDIAIPMNAAGTDGSAIILPTAAGSGVSVKLTTADGKVFNASLDASLAIASGTVNTFTMTLKRTAASITATVTPWATGTETNLQLPLIESAGNSVELPTGIDGKFYLTTAESTTTFTALYNWTGNAFAAVSPIYWEQLMTTAHDFAATFTPNADVPTGSNLEKDILTAATANVAFGAQIPLTMQHAMSGLNVSLTSENSGSAATGNLFTADELKAATVTFATAQLSSLNTSTGALTFSATSSPLTATLPLIDAAKILFSGLTAPQTIQSVCVAIGGKTYTVNKTMEMKAGYANSLVLNITKTETGIDVTLADWKVNTLDTINAGIDD